MYLVFGAPVAPVSIQQVPEVIDLYRLDLHLRRESRHIEELRRCSVSLYEDPKSNIRSDSVSYCLHNLWNMENTMKKAKSKSNNEQKQIC